MDIEGTEQKVLFASQNNLPLIKQMIIEFHTHHTQSLKKLLELLQKTHAVVLYKNGKPIKLQKAKGLIIIEAKLLTQN